jgi:HdeA/HdeB family
MKIYAVSIALLMMLGFGVTTASADKMDFAKMTCADLLKLPDDDKGLIMVWLEGYFNKRNSPAVLDTDQMTTEGTALGRYCGANSTASVLEAATAAGVAQN